VEAVEMKSTFWRGKRVFLTGHTGFKGSWLSLWLQSLGAEVSGYALPPPPGPSLFESARVGKGMHSILADVRDLEKLANALRESRAEIVFHLAAQPLVRQSYVDPVETYSTNVMGTVHLLEAVRRTPGVRAVINVTTDKCYENREWLWGYRENEPMGGYDPYSNSKGCSELVTSAYRSSFFNPRSHAEHGVAVATARAGNVIGGGDWAKDRLIPDIMAAMLRGQPVLIRNPHAIRPWQHVLEPLRGYLMLAERLCEAGPEYAEAWNFGPNDEDARPVEWIAGFLTHSWGGGATWQVDGARHPHEAHFLKLDISKARSRLGWHPVLALEQALTLVTEWHREIGRNGDARTSTLQQIQHYSALAGIDS
jgi:CDP-glucose 4,6-dehydratase